MFPFGNFTNQAINDGEGFAPPTYGGALAVKFNSLTFASAGTAVNLFTLPQGAILVAILVNVTTAFNSSGTDLLDIGTSATADAYANDLNVATAGQIVTGFVPGALFTALTVDTTVTATFAQSVADATAGAATVAVLYMLR